LDCANQGPEYVRLEGYPHKTYIGLNSPILKNIDEYGLIVGMIKNLGELLRFNMPKTNENWVKWGFFVPSQTGMHVLGELVKNGKVRIKNS